MDLDEIAIETKGISKEFSGVRVLDNINLKIRRGEIMGLIGENGAGKSTLIKILCGIYQPSEGEIFLYGKSAQIKDYLSARGMGIGIVPQEFNLINHLAVYENIFLGNEIRKGAFLDKAAMKKKAASQMEALKMKVDVNNLVSDLSVAGKQMVEVAKALMLRARILVFDEPTTTLTGNEVKVLFKLMADLKAEGVTIIFVSHKLNEVKAICDRIAVLRDGKLITVEDTKDVGEADIARQMVGREFTKVFPPKIDRSGEKIVLEAEGLSIPGLLENISFNLRRGEILGFAGLVGAGRTETMEALMGIRKIESGKIKLNGSEIQIKKPSGAVKHKIGYISEDRQGKGIVQEFDIPKNISLISMKWKYKKSFLIDRKKEQEASQGYVKNFGIVAASMKLPLKFLSGGNQQKVYLSRWMDTEPQILILDEPTRGIDVKAKQEIYEFIHSLGEKGISCILISSEMEEIIGLCTRVYVMKEGRITNCLSGSDINEEEIMFNATGLKGR